MLLRKWHPIPSSQGLTQQVPWVQHLLMNRWLRTFWPSWMMPHWKQNWIHRLGNKIINIHNCLMRFVLFWIILSYMCRSLGHLRQQFFPNHMNFTVIANDIQIHVMLAAKRHWCSHPVCMSLEWGPLTFEFHLWSLIVLFLGGFCRGVRDTWWSTAEAWCSPWDSWCGGGTLSALGGQGWEKVCCSEWLWY